MFDISYLMQTQLHLIKFTFMHLADAFIQSDVTYSEYIFVSMCVPWELNSQPFPC